MARAKDLWLEFLTPDTRLCGLCGNKGIVDTTGGKISGPVGQSCEGIRQFCICPNGRAIKKAREGR